MEALRDEPRRLLNSEKRHRRRGIVLELWGVIAVAGSAGALASFFHTGDSE